MDEKVPVIHKTSWNRINEEATNLLEEYQPDALTGKEPVEIDGLFDFDLPEIMLERHGIVLKTGVTDLSIYQGGVGKLLGITDAKSGICLIDKSVYETDDPVQIRRGRATMAHETYHCLCHVPRMLTFISGSNDSFREAFPRMLKSEVRPFEDPEQQAWKFAQMLMMPKAAIQRFLKEGRDEFWMAEFFDVNPAFVRVRLGCKTLK